MINTKKKVIVLPADAMACGLYRVLQPYRAIKRDYKDDPDIEFTIFGDDKNVTGAINSNVLIDYLSKFDAAVFQRPATFQILDIMENVKRLGVKVYVELDDALFNVHPSNPASMWWKPGTDSWKVLKRAIEVADKLTLSTPELQTMYQKDAVVFENGIDLSLPIYSPENNRRHQLPKDKTIIGWAGSTSHVDSLKGLIKPIKKLMSQRDDCIFALCSNPEFMDYFDIPKEKKQYVKHKPISEWPPVMSLFDVNIATVKVDPFNSGKSELKVLEAGVWGVPSVCTFVAPYKRFAQRSNGGCALVYENDVNEWVQTLNKIIDNTILRQEMSEKTLETIKTVYDIREINKKRVEFFKSELC